MPGTIDYAFIRALEGSTANVGYVSKPRTESGGVRLASGFDLGKTNAAQLQTFGLAWTLTKLLKPYLGLTGDQARATLADQPLEISTNDARAIDRMVKAMLITPMATRYNRAPGNSKKFSSLPSAAQTVMASVCVQYGVGLDAVAPRFWKAVTCQDWPGAIYQLKHFGDAYPTRRRKEAALLEKLT